MNRLKKVCICSSFNGCSLNSYLLTRVYDFLIANGISVSADPDECDAVIIGTCANLNADEKKAVDFISGQIKKYRGRKKIIITGCLPDINPAYFKENPSLIGIGAKQLDKFDAIFGARKRIKDFSSNSLNERFCLDELVADNSYFQYYAPSRYYVEISRGCLNNCSYCAIKKAKGVLKSKPLNSVIGEFRKGIKLGFRKFVLLADECGGYGWDCGSSFAQLLLRLSKLKDGLEISVSNLEPAQLVKMYPSLKGVLPKIKITDLLLPLQSGNSRILKLMNRRYRVSEVIEIVQDIKAVAPKTDIQTHLIYCFPSETRKEFLDSVKMAGYFDGAAFFLYSPRSGTRAAGLKQGISRKEIIYRTAYLKKLIARDPKKYCFGNAEDEHPFKKKGK